MGLRDDRARMLARHERAFNRALAERAGGVKATDGNRELPLDRDTLGRMVREAWVRWANTQPNPKSSWLVSYDELAEPDKEADRQIGETVARWTLIYDAARLSTLTTEPAARQEPDFAGSIAALIKDECEGGAACGWRSCTGCHETSEGYETGHYPYSKMFGCYAGSGCRECGGLGVVWHYWSGAAQEAMQRDAEPEGQQEAFAETVDTDTPLQAAAANISEAGAARLAFRDGEQPGVLEIISVDAEGKCVVHRVAGLALINLAFKAVDQIKRGAR